MLSSETTVADEHQTSRNTKPVPLPQTPLITSTNINPDMDKLFHP